MRADHRSPLRAEAGDYRLHQHEGLSQVAPTRTLLSQTKPQTKPQTNEVSNLRCCSYSSSFAAAVKFRCLASTMNSCRSSILIARPVYCYLTTVYLTSFNVFKWHT
jgi:hypothetical protein